MEYIFFLINPTQVVMSFTIFIKGIYSFRSKLLVRQSFVESKIPIVKVELGELVFETELSPEEVSLVKKKLGMMGFSIQSDKRAKIAAKIKSSLEELLTLEPSILNQNLSGFISGRLFYEYHYLSNLFSELEQTTIEQFFIKLKVERAKEQIEEGGLNFYEIAYRLGYSSHSHFTNQFKKVTGVTPSQYKSSVQKSTNNDTF